MTHSDRLEALLRLPSRERLAELRRLSEEERREFAYHWQLWARDEQLAPGGDWQIWLILAGRGFGKTRAGAEWVRAVAAAEPGARIALVAATLGEARAVTLLDPAMPEAARANLPLGWAAPAFDRLQLEDYDWLTAGADSRRRAAYAVVNDRLGYPPEAQDYFAGFVLLPEQADLWRRIDTGIDEALLRSPHEIVVWALPQVCRDGYVRLPNPEDSDMQAFDDVLYPLALGLDTGVAPEFSTSVAVTASGHERRSSLWSDARLRFDVGPGVRSEAEIGTLIAFFRARRGAARGFRLRDPSDHSSNGMTGTPTAADQLLGVGDGDVVTFALVKHYGGRPAPLPTGYALRSHRLPALDEIAEACGFAETASAALPGDVLMLRPSPCQHHLAIAAERARFVHAHAGLRRVVVMPGPAGWPVLRRWRLLER